MSLYWNLQCQFKERDRREENGWSSDKSDTWALGKLSEGGKWL